MREPADHVNGDREAALGSLPCGAIRFEEGVQAMRLSTRGRYAVMAMVELAARQERAAKPSLGKNVAPVSLAEIAASQMLSLAYLEQLFGPLRRAGLVASARGPGGGYRLARLAREISISAIVDAVDEPIRATRCEDGAPGCIGGRRCITHDLWAELGEQIRLFLDGVTLHDVVHGDVLGRAMAPQARELTRA
jgi:Rrf2 family transcriptional regulator, iron-sulfur cluster assembly transcription factor